LRGTKGEESFSLCKLSGRRTLETALSRILYPGPWDFSQNLRLGFATWAVPNGPLAVLGGSTGESQPDILAEDVFCLDLFGYIYKFLHNVPGQDIGVCTLAKLKDLD
jgi:hypothetical protein